jgi:hypothetical protein
MIRIYDKANGELQFESELDAANEAWQEFRGMLGYDQDIPGTCERSAYVWTNAESIRDVSECRDF